MTTRIEPLALAETDERTRAALEQARKKAGMLPNAYRVMANAPALLEGYLALHGHLEGGRLSRRMREQVALAVAARNQCSYCLAAHRIGGRFAKLSAAEIAAAERGEAADPREALFLRLALALLERCGDLGDELFAEARAAGVSDAELVELAGHVALNQLTNSVNRLARTPNDFAGAGIRAVTEVAARLGLGG